MRGLSERFACVIHLRLVARLERLLGIRNRVLHIATLAAGDLISLLAQHLLDLVDQRVELVLGLDLLALGFVLSRVRFRAAMGRSPCSTCTSTEVWLSAAVENVSVLRVGIVVLRGIIGVATPPSVSIASVSGVTSSKSRSFTSPLRTPPWIAAPTATTSSGFTPLWPSLPNSSFTSCWMRGMRVCPPTSTTSLILLASTPASF